MSRGAELERGRSGSNAGALAARAGWLGGWMCILALAAWSAQLSPGWLAAAAAGAALWSACLPGLRPRRSLGVAVLLWVAVGLGAGVELRLWQAIHDWPALERGIEDRAADALGGALDALVDRGQDAVAGVQAALRPGGGGAGDPGRLFRRLEVVRRETDVSALAIFDRRGDPVAWAGEHRGELPLSVRRGSTRYSFHGSPLFSYVYFTRALGGGRTAVAAVLLEAELPSGSAVPSFASRFRARHGVTPLFTRPERARGRSVWDWSVDRPILSVSFAALAQQSWWERLVHRGRGALGVLLAVATAALVASGAGRRATPPALPVALVTVAALAFPLGAVTGAAELFSPVRFVLPLPVDVPLGTFLLLLAGLAVWLVARLGGASSAPCLPLALRGVGAALAVPAALWLVNRSAASALLAARPAGGFPLQLTTALLLALPLFLLLRCGTAPTPRRGGAPLALGAVLALGMSLARAILWSPGRPLPLWANAAWALPFLLLAAAPSRGRRPAFHAWMVAAGLSVLVALPHLWTLHQAARLRSAEREIGRLGTRTDPFLDFLLRQFAGTAGYYAEEGEEGLDLLYHAWVASGLASEGFEARLTIWRDGQPEAELPLAEVDSVPDVVPVEVARAEGTGTPVVEHFTRVPGLHYLLVAPLPDGRTVSVAVPPRSRLGGATALARFLDAGGGSPSSAVESLHLVPAAEVAPGAAPPDPRDASAAGPVRWLPAEAGWRSEARARFPSGWVHVHLFVRSSGLSLLIVRGLLLGGSLLAVLLALWLLGRLVCGEVPRVERGWVRSFRGRLTLALFGFFLLPTSLFGLVSYGAVSREVFRSASALAQRALEQAVKEMAARLPLSRVGAHVGTDLLLYRNGSLSNAAAPEALDLGLFDAWLPPEVALAFRSGEDLQSVDRRRLGERDYLVAYRRLDDAAVLAAPIPLASEEVARRQTEFRDIALFISLLGAGLSVVLALLVGRALSRPIDELSRAAAAVGSGNLKVRLPEERPDEFGGVYRSFNRMVRRLQRARAAEVKTARVLAWGEMARQVAHEIKNPLTPIKLAVQHLRRAYHDRRPDYDRILDRNVEAILHEIDRLGEIARAFSRFGTPQPTTEALEHVDVASVVGETLALYRGAGTGIRFVADAEPAAGLRALARVGELKEVLVNLLENARDALDGAGEIRVTAAPTDDGHSVELVVADDGEGIPPAVMAHIFEPHFSTRTSGTGLGLAIVRRMVDSWGGAITADSHPDAGTRMRVRMRRATDGSTPTGAEHELRSTQIRTEQEFTAIEEAQVTDLKKGVQRGAGETGGVGEPSGGDAGEHNRGAEFGTSERASRGTDGDLDRSGTSKNQAHGHPREERENGG